MVLLPIAGVEMLFCKFSNVVNTVLLLILVVTVAKVDVAVVIMVEVSLTTLFTVSIVSFEHIGIVEVLHPTEVMTVFVVSLLILLELF